MGINGRLPHRVASNGQKASPILLLFVVRVTIHWYFQLIGARIGWARTKWVERFMGELVSSAQENYNERWRVWVDNREGNGHECSTLRNYKIRMDDCNLLLPYICERGNFLTVLYFVDINVVNMVWTYSRAASWSYHRIGSQEPFFLCLIQSLIGYYRIVKILVT